MPDETADSQLAGRGATEQGQHRHAESRTEDAQPGSGGG